jgi:hypothetical protein
MAIVNRIKEVLETEDGMVMGYEFRTLTNWERDIEWTKSKKTHKRLLEMFNDKNLRKWEEWKGTGCITRHASINNQWCGLLFSTKEDRPDLFKNYKENYILIITSL